MLLFSNVFIFFIPASADASRRVALVIGNAAHVDMPVLQNPKNADKVL